MRELAELFFAFARISASCFGGGYAMLPFFQSELVEKKGWLSGEELLDVYALAQCTPGVIAVNTATFCGYRKGGVPGAIAASLGVIFPPLVIVSVISAFFWHFAEYSAVQHALAGVRACVCAIVLNSVLRLFRSAVIDVPTAVIFAAVFLLAAFAGVSPPVLVAAAGVCGAILSLTKRRAAK